MMFGRRSCKVASLLILMMNVFKGHTLACDQSHYEIHDKCCPKCSPGKRVETDCSETNSTSCLPCAEGTFMNQPTKRTRCFDCRRCNARSGLKIKTSCTAMSNAVCEPLEGYYCTGITEDSCMMAQKHTSCQPGQYISQKATGTASIDTECSDCSAGTYSDGTFTSCQPHKQCEEMNLLLITPGTTSTDAECGEKSSNQTATVIGSVVFGLLFVGAVVVVFVFYHRKKNKCLKKGDREKNAVKLKQYDTKKEDVNGDTQETSQVLEQNHTGEEKRNPDCQTQNGSKKEDLNGDAQKTSRVLEQNHIEEVKRNPDCPTQNGSKKEDLNGDAPEMLQILIQL